MRRIKAFTFLISALLTLSGNTVKGQVITQPFDEIYKDTNSIFYRFSSPELRSKPSKSVTSSSFSFGITKIITLRDTFAAYIRIDATNPDSFPTKDRNKFRSMLQNSSPLKSIGNYTFISELLNRRDNTGIRPYVWGQSGMIKHFRDKKRLKYTTYMPVYKNGKGAVIKCLTAYIDYYPLDWSKNTVKYRVHYKKYRRLPKYGFLVQGPYGAKIQNAQKGIELHKKNIVIDKYQIKESIKQNKITAEKSLIGMKQKIDKDEYPSIEEDGVNGCCWENISSYQKKLANDKRSLKLYKYALKHYKKANRRSMKGKHSVEKIKNGAD